MVRRATARGICRWVPMARAMVLTPMKVAPNRTAAPRAEALPVSSAGSAMPTAWRDSEIISRAGREKRRARRIHSAHDGRAARPTTIQALLPIRPGAPCWIAATRNVPAMM